MALVPASGDIYRVVTVSESPTQNGLNVSHWWVSFQSSTQTLGTVFDALDLDFAAVYAPWLPTLCNYIGLIVQRISPTPVLDRIFTSHAPVPGTQDDEFLPTQDCGAITLLTGFAGRKFRGRKYIPFPAKGYNEGQGVPTAAAKTFLDAIGPVYTTPKTVVGGGGATTITPVLWHPGDSTFTQLVTWQTRNYFTTQRRRGKASKVDALIPAFA